MQTKKWYLTLDLKNDTELIESYEHYHQPAFIWPEIVQGNHQAGIIDLEIFRAGNRLFMILTTAANTTLDEIFAQLSELPRQKEWANFMLQYQQPLTIDGALKAGQWVLMHQVYSQKQCEDYLNCTTAQ